MAINKATLAKEIDGVIEYIYPKTSGDIVVYDDTRSVSAMISMLVNNKVDKEDGKGLSTNDFTNTLKNRLEGIEIGANKTVIDDALSSTSNNAIANKTVKTALEAKEQAHRIILYKMRANGWTGNTYSFEAEYPGNTYNLYINTAYCQPSEYEALARATLMASNLESGLNVVTAMGDVPNIDIPVMLEIVRRN